MPDDVNSLNSMLDESYDMPFSPVPSCSTTITVTSSVSELESEMLYNEMEKRAALLLEIKVLKSHSFPLDAISIKEDSDKCLILVDLTSEVSVCLLGYLGYTLGH